MASMVATAADSREEMDENVALRPAPHDAKARFLIRTLPRECNPTPVTVATQSTNVSSGGGMVTTALLSPKARKPSGFGGESAAVEPAESDNPFDDITEEKLQKLTGKADLARVTSLQLAVDSGKQSLEVIGELLPSLRQLRLQPGSTLHSFRDLGTSLHSLQTLWVTQCGIRELDGISALTELQELHLQNNHVSDISPLTMHDELQIVDLEANLIDDVGQIEQLAFCPQLASLTLRGNPLCRMQHYRRIVANFLPQLDTLDGKPIGNDERTKLTDDEIDAAIQMLREVLDAEAAEVAPLSARPESSHGRRQDDSTPGGLSRAPSAVRLDASHSAQDSMRDDYGSTLTHGTDIVFAGNVTSALRRHRCETEGSDALATAAAVANGTGVAVKYPTMERPPTPARESITATLDRANELERHKSRDAILHELKAWRLETAGSSDVGVVSMDGEVISPSTSPTKRPPSSSGSGRVSTAERRPNTSAGIVRQGVNVREAFVESSSSSRSRAETPLVKRHSSGSPVVVPSFAVPTSSSRNVDILILDEEPQHDDQHPCSPHKTSRGVFTTSTRSGGDWNLEEIAPKLDLESTESFLQRSSRRKSVGEEDADADADADSASSGSDSEDMRLVARQLKQRKPTAKPPTHAKAKGFFNVAESLHAIDRWREQMDDDAAEKAALPPNDRRGSHRKSSRDDAADMRPAAGGSTTSEVSSSSSGGLGLACRSTDEQVVQWMREKHANVAEIKTRDGFRRFFRGIDEPRLARILHKVFADSEKVRRRLQLMQGFYSGQVS